MCQYVHSFISVVLPPPYRCFYVTHGIRALKSHDLSGQGINSGSHTYFLSTQGHGDHPRMRDKLNAGATSEKTRTRKTIHAIHAPIHSNKMNMKKWLWRPNDVRGPYEPKASWHVSYRWRKTLKKPHPGNPDRGSKLGPMRDRRACYRLFHSGGQISIHKY